jgi:DNA-binding GntR family transcriptional regulator
MSDGTDRGSVSTLQPIERRNLGSDVYRILRDRILRQQLKAGEKLSDLRLSNELGVSRTPIREALHQLVQDGVVVAEPNRGFFVATFSQRDLEEIFELRLALELFAARRLTQKDRREELERALFELEHVERLLRNAKTPEQMQEAADAFLKTDRGFHSWLVSTAENKRLDTIINSIWTQVAIFQQIGSTIPDWVHKALKQHRQVIEHLLEGDIEGAAEIMEQHLYDMQDEVLADHAAQQSDAR